ncbi:gamma-glutamyltransferase [Salinibacter ruber]|uniref:gamma-glutamyltransferase n=1 Tax=Salinibacter ruber TaxID=146919 RepID=UPI002168C054|nr:gamma-glutamyltransferase [Salinibacter ruber]MCS3640310.1 gamma-glutamyltranspeptidase/glutathione hydrolase [Salinibacter ruber]
MRRLSPFPLLLCALLLAAPPALAQNGDGGGDRLTGPDFARSPVTAQRGMAATSQPLASQIAVDVLKQGGSAVDAAIAANAALGLMEPTGNGLGGDLFAIVYDPETDSTYGLNASGRSPQGLSYDEMQQALGDRDQIPLLGHLPVSVPGTASGWGKLHARFGALPLREDLAPAIEYARDGFPLSQVIAYYWQGNVESFRENSDMLPDSENWKETYLIEGEGGQMRAPEEGEVFRNPDLASTLETIAENGTEAFYQGEIAQTIADYAERTGGYLRMEDLRQHEANWVDPVSVDYRGVEVFELPPNGQGIAALQMLQILKGYDVASMGHNSTDYLHVQAEAKKLAFEDRARFYADPAFADVPVQQLISEEYGAQRRQQIEMDEVLSAPDAGTPRSVTTSGLDPAMRERLNNGDTIYLTVADSSGMMVSLIQSNYAGMGSGLVPDGLGFMLQDRGALFTMEQGHPNVYEPGKRPFHTIIPAFATKDGEPFLSFGVMGGGMQPQGHVQVLSNIVDFGLNVQAAGDAARYRHYGSSSPTGEDMDGRGTLRVESGVSEDVVNALRGRGHSVSVGAGGYGGYQAIRWDPEEEVYWGGTEMRKDGYVVGY